MENKIEIEKLEVFIEHLQGLLSCLRGVTSEISDWVDLFVGVDV